jgi:hypothetical protein
MSIRPKAIAVPVLGILLFAACAANQPEQQARTGGGVEHRDGATIISGVALDDGPGSVLSALRGKVPSFRVQRPSGECPKISLRNFVTFATVVNPHVYVDGTRTNDTCILETLRTEDVELVEVYSMGFTSRPGYAPHSQGLILVFMRR